MVVLSETKDFNLIRNAYLVFGPECNMQCRHCHQTPKKNGKSIVRHISDETMSFLDNFIKYSQKEEFIKQNKKKLFTLTLYGGEVLLHWDMCKKLITYFTEKYDLLSNKSFRFAVVTNGLLLTEEFVDFANQYEIYVRFSYDAPYPWAVRSFVSDKICSLINKINDVTVIASGCAYNCDPLLVRRCLELKFPKADYTIRLEVLRTFHEMDKDIDTYDFKKVKESIHKLFIAAKLGSKFACSYIQLLISAKSHPNTDWDFYHRTHCGSCMSGYKRLAVTPVGDILFCCNAGQIIGNIKTDTLEDVFTKVEKIWQELYDPACKECELKDYCYWGCVLLLQDNNKHSYNCENFRKPFYKILREEVALMDKPVTKEELAWFVQQKQLIEKQARAFMLEGQRYEMEHTRFPKTML